MKSYKDLDNKKRIFPLISPIILFLRIIDNNWEVIFILIVIKIELKNNKILIKDFH